MAGVTNQLVKCVTELAPLHDPAEYDAVVATGEQVTVGPDWRIALQEMGVPARSWPGLADSAGDRRRARQGAHRGASTAPG
jgi:aspartate kinase